MIARVTPRATIPHYENPRCRVTSGLGLEGTCKYLIERWRHDGQRSYAQFDNGTVFQGAHQFANAVGGISRLCLQLNVIPVFAPPLEHGMQKSVRRTLRLTLSWVMAESGRF